MKDDIIFPADSTCFSNFRKDSHDFGRILMTAGHLCTGQQFAQMLIGYRFKDDNSLLQIKNLGIQLDHMFGTGSRCEA